MTFRIWNRILAFYKRLAFFKGYNSFFKSFRSWIYTVLLKDRNSSICVSSKLTHRIQIVNFLMVSNCHDQNRIYLDDALFMNLLLNRVLLHLNFILLVSASIIMFSYKFIMNQDLAFYWMDQRNDHRLKRRTIEWKEKLLKALWGTFQSTSLIRFKVDQ